MRSPQCIASSSEYIRNLGQTPVSAEVDESCCNTCYLSGKNVDLYYWPQPGADTSCLNIIGGKVDPLDFGATTSIDSILSETTTYWGCTARTPLSGDSIIKTAQITAVGSLTYKVPLVNPWSPPQCIKTSTPDADSNVSTTANSFASSIQAHPIPLLPPSITNNDGTPVTTVVTNGHTFTSPSVYANFFGIGAGDWCGKTTIVQTMLTFAPGELSTIAGPLYSGISAGHPRPDLPTKVFNLADLPCPPQSVMEENWYTPVPGDPYRPLLAIPSKVRAINPFFSSCTDLWFDAIDPPRALAAEAAMETASVPPPLFVALSSASALVPPETANGNISPTILPPRPGGMLPAGPTKTNVANNEPSPEPQHKSKGPKSNEGPVDPQQGSLASFNPQKVSPNEMSEIDQALKTDSKPDPPSATDPRKSSGQQFDFNGKAGDPVTGSHDPLFADPDPSAGQGSAFDEAPTKVAPEDTAPTPTIIMVGNHAVKIAPSAVQVDGVSVNLDQLPVSLPRNAAAMINKNHNNVVIGSKIYHVSPLSDKPNIGPDSPAPMTTTLPDGATAVILPMKTTGSSDEDTPGNAADISIYGTTLKPGSPPVIVTTTAPNGKAGMLTLSLDSNGNIIYNPVAHSLPQLTFPTKSTPLPSQVANTPITTSILNNQRIVILPHGQGISIAGTTLSPSPVQSGRDEIMISGTEVSLLGTSALVIGGSSTITLPSDSTALTTGSAVANGPGATGPLGAAGTYGSSSAADAASSRTIAAFSPGKTDVNGRVTGAAVKRSGVPFSGLLFVAFVWTAVLGL